MVKRILFSIFFLTIPLVHAQDSGQSADSGVLVSSPTHTEVPDQDNSDGSNGGNNDTESKAPVHSSTDPIVIKATDAVMFQMIANLKMSQDQIDAVRPIVMDNIVKVRSLQQSVEDGTIDSKAMVEQRKGLTGDEDQQLSHILSADQMKVWLNMQEYM